MDKISQYIRDIQSQSEDFANLIKQVQQSFLQHDPALEQTIKYGGLVFLQNGQLIGGVFPYKKHLSIEFSFGAEFDDPNKNLQGKGKFRRHLKLQSVDEMETIEADFYIRQCIELKHE